ncbi:Kinase [Hexamita inflata]|uniref:Kinase n=1 Tax=Hexamita inflata TaxID=28002 RepID=A0ABP1KR12_9EUKA
MIKLPQLLAEKGILIINWFNKNVCLVVQGTKIAVLKHSIDQEQLLNEYNILHQEQSTHVIKCGQFQRLGNYSMFEMKYANTRDLGWYIALCKKQNGVNPAHAKSFTLQILYAVQKLHHDMIMHCDIKVENILLHMTNKKYNVLLCDFGSAINIRQTNQKYQPNTTLINIPPEIQQQQEWTFESDIFQLGIVIYQLWVGHHPFQNGFQQIQIEYNEVFQNHTDQKRIEKSRYQFISVLQRMLSEKPYQRYNIDEIIELLDLFFESYISDSRQKEHSQPRMDINEQSDADNSDIYRNQLVFDNDQKLKAQAVTPLPFLERDYEFLNQLRPQNDCFYCLVMSKNEVDKNRYSVEVFYVDMYTQQLQLLQDQIQQQLELQYIYFVRKIKQVWIEQNLMFTFSYFDKKDVTLNQYLNNIQKSNQHLSVKKRQGILIQLIIFLKEIHSQDLAYNQIDLYSIFKTASSGVLNGGTDEIVEIRLTNFRQCYKDGFEYSLQNCDSSIFQSPQQIITIEKQQVLKSSKQNDIWALGMIAYYLEYYEIPDLNYTKENSDQLSREIVKIASQGYKHVSVNEIYELASVQEVYNQLINQSKLNTTKQNNDTEKTQLQINRVTVISQKRQIIYQ